MRRDFAPLELFADIVTASAGSGVTQVYDGATGEHEPDRSITPLVLVPYVLAEAPDGSFSGGDVREQLRNGRWYVNGTAIESATGWSGGFTVSQEAGTKWQLTVRRNFTPGERADLTFRAELADTRTGVLVPVTCGPVTLTCTERASDMWSLMTGGDTIMIYDPLRDNLLRHDYLVAEGQEAESTPAREALEKEQTSYVRRVPVELWRGGEKWARPWALVVAKIGPSGDLTRVRAGDGDLISCDDSTGLVMDLRLTEKTDLALLACVPAADAGTAGTDVPVSVGVAFDEGVDLSLSRSFKAGDNIATGTNKLQGGQTGEGGMVVTDDDELATACRYFKNMCFPLDAPRTYLHADIGYNYRMSNLHAAIGLAQTEKADAYKALRQAHGRQYRERLRTIPGVLLQEDTAGSESVNWMNSNAAFWMLVISYLWKNLGYTMILWMAGLGAIPRNVYEAAQVDGATGWQTFRYVTAPNLRPTAYTITVLSLLNAFKVFREAWLVAGDYPHESMYLLQHLYNNWFRELDFDKISAASVMTSAVVFVLIGFLRRAWDQEV